MKKFFVPILILLLLSGFSYADGLAIKDGKLIKVDAIVNPSINFIKPNVINTGLIIVSADIKDYAPESVSKSEYDWTVKQDGSEVPFIVSKKESVIALGGVPGAKRIDIELKLKLTYPLEDGDFVLNVASKTEILGDQSPVPPPPPPNPDPVLREHARFFRDLFQSGLNNTSLDRNLILTSARAQARNYRSVAENVGKPGYAPGKQVLDAVYAANNSTIAGYGNPELLDFWDSFGDKQADYLYALYNTNKLDYKDIFIQIAEGLEAIK